MKLNHTKFTARVGITLKPVEAYPADAVYEYVKIRNAREEAILWDSSDKVLKRENEVSRLQKELDARQIELNKKAELIANNENLLKSKGLVIANGRVFEYPEINTAHTPKRSQEMNM